MARPDLFIVGAPKCGTTAMWRYLNEHPEVFIAERKDIHYFGSDLGFRDRQGDDEATYLARFADVGGATRVGEASVWYLYSRKAAEEINAFNPSARAIIMLRDPVEVMYALHSQYLFNGLGDEDITDFEQALAAEEDRRQGRRIPPHNRLPETLQYREVVRFTEQIQRYQAVFGPDRVHVVLQDDMKADTPAVYRQVLEFLDIDPDFQPELGRVNTHKVVRSQALRKVIALTPKPLKELLPGDLRGRLRKGLRSLNSKHERRPHLDPALKARLQREQLPEVESLEALLDRDLSAWKAT